ncbi:hypothetical protein BC833DRAFT_220184 [Globomyces pollinis-pini]|nr:hypothetical protein BC833DRAFT_220184 [Globomyces pollinis-pini]
MTRKNISKHGTNSNKKLSQKKSNSRPKFRRTLEWNTIKYLIAYSILTIFIWGLVTYNYSTESHPNYQLYKHRLDNGWFFGRKIDNSDAQYRPFRNQLPILFAVMIGHQIITKLIGYISISGYSQVGNQFKAYWTLIFSFIFCFVLFGFSILKIIFFTGINLSLRNGVKNQ